ncbi:PSD1 and planctomycete cytochrome C domain-containing protein [Aquisphaera insulae]|uniref:PSD1 and planctomycete cytochrome C domain-containing protein n=1 Tax=Aquisphaera insulae TaxID=2712864 RepID=UPI0013ECBE0C|nr:PSD1 and planctomycete cytochrome C domain-containing protein [Aquisphaera insulae]
MTRPPAPGRRAEPSVSPGRLGVAGATVAAVALVFGTASAMARGDDPAATAFFESKIRPVLVEHCAKCHGASAAAPKGGLRVDTREGLRRGGDSGPAVVAGKPEESLLLQAIARTGEVSAMPPKEPLPASIVADFRAWIARGAADPRDGMGAVASAASASGSGDWWSLRPLNRPDVPTVEGAGKGSDDVRNPIDAFLLAKLRAKGLTPQPEADRLTLIRRLCFDLTGLPPSPEEAEAFVRDADPRAYEKLVDRLLASPAFGERWARHWMDAIHFADTHGFEHDVFRPNAWRYRDYLIAAINRDTPWPRFIREQLAADVFYPDEPRLTAALGFLGAGPYDLSAASTAPTSFENLDRDDLVTQTMAAFVSATVHCARCHSHKFDPIPQEDYYALQAVFAGIGKGDLAYDEDAEVHRRRKQAHAMLAAAESGKADALLSTEARTMVARWEGSRGKPPAWAPLDAEVFVASDGSTLRKLNDGSLIAEGPRPERETYTVTIAATSAPRPIGAVRLDVLPDDALPAKGPGRAHNGNLHLSEIEILAFRPGAGTPERRTIRRASADWNQPDWGVARAIDGDPATAWGIFPRVGVSHFAVFELDGTLTLEPGARLVVVLKQLHGGSHLIGRFRLSSAATSGDAVVALPPDAERALRIEPGRRTPDQARAVAVAVLRLAAERELASLPAPVKVYAAGRTVEVDGKAATMDRPRVIRVLKRGDLSTPAAEVGPGALSAVTVLKPRFDAIPAGAGEGVRRASLADWLADPKNPLTWRSVANRVWQGHFGAGLCDTPSDFGRMGGLPSHPELLDWLAAEIRDDGGSLKSLHRLICTSAAYRRSSASVESSAAADPDNRLLWRMNRRRLDADGFRDAVLAVSGRIDRRAGGPGVAHFRTSPGPQVTPKVDYDAFDWDAPGAGRRSIYRVVWRGIPDPLMDALDFPDAALLTPSRGFSASPLQALSLLNNDFVLRQSEHLAARAQAAGPTAAGRIRAAFRIVVLREPTATEEAAFAALAGRHSLAAACRVLLNSNEFLFVD